MVRRHAGTRHVKTQRRSASWMWRICPREVCRKRDTGSNAAIAGTINLPVGLLANRVLASNSSNFEGSWFWLWPYSLRCLRTSADLAGSQA